MSTVDNSQYNEHIIQYTVVWGKFMVRNIRAKKIHDKKFSSKQATDEKFFNAEY